MPTPVDISSALSVSDALFIQLSRHALIDGACSRIGRGDAGEQFRDTTHPIHHTQTQSTDKDPSDSGQARVSPLDAVRIRGE